MRRSAAGSKMQYDGNGAENKESLGVLIKVTVLNRKIFEERSFFAVALEMGASGIIIESDRIMEPGQKVKCTLILRRKIDVGGEIVKAVSAAAGVFHYEVNLMDVDPNARVQLKELAKQR